MDRLGAKRLAATVGLFSLIACSDWAAPPTETDPQLPPADLRRTVHECPDCEAPTDNQHGDMESAISGMIRDDIAVCQDIQMRLIAFLWGSRLGVYTNTRPRYGQWTNIHDRPYRIGLNSWFWTEDISETERQRHVGQTLIHEGAHDLMENVGCPLEDTSTGGCETDADALMNQCYIGP